MTVTGITANRFLLDAALQPVQGSRFAPTGFADLGAAVFDRPTDDGWVKSLLVESAQSMANRLEATLWDAGSARPVASIADLPYIHVVDDDGNHLTSSREESHRLASPYVRYASSGATDGLGIINDALKLSETAPHDYRRLALAVLSLDPLALVHGVFFAGKGAKEFPGQPKFTRLITGFIEAHDVRAAESGGVKRDHVNHTQASSGGDATEGYGSVPFARTEWTARTITASFNIDLAQLRSYGLPDPAEQLLAAIAQLEIATLLAQPLRLRTNCDLEVLNEHLVARSGEPLDDIATLASRVADLAGQCRANGLLGEVVELRWSPKRAK